MTPVYVDSAHQAWTIVLGWLFVYALGAMVVYSIHAFQRGEDK
jgi:hypothetical protein